MVECSAIYDSACVSTRKMKLRVQQFLLAAAFLAQALLTDGKGKNYYSTLGLKKNAKENAIKKAYRCVSAVRSTSHGLPVLLSAVYSQAYVPTAVVFSDHIFPVCRFILSGRSTIDAADSDREVHASLHQEAMVPGCKPGLRAWMPLPDDVLILVRHEVERYQPLFHHFLHFPRLFL